jgi:hypothetical protein
MIAAVELYRPSSVGSLPLPLVAIRSFDRSFVRSFVRATPVRPRDDDAEEEARSTIERRAR